MEIDLTKKEKMSPLEKRSFFEACEKEKLGDTFKDEELYIKLPNKHLLFFKRSMDIIISLLLLILLSPLLFATTALIMVLTNSPVIFFQERVGYKGKIFNMPKFTTMVNDAQKQDEYLANASEVHSLCFRLPNDPRITNVGLFLRKYSIDELPQLFSVLIGDMSLVGPRPYAVYEFKQLKDWQKQVKTAMKPGLTCILQTSGRTSVRDYDERLKMDLEYINNWSLLMDLKLLFKTIPVILCAKGAS